MVSSFMSYKILVRKHLNYIIFAPIIVEGSKKKNQNPTPSCRPFGSKFYLLFVLVFRLVSLWTTLRCRRGRHCALPRLTLCPPSGYTVLSKSSHIISFSSLYLKIILRPLETMRAENLSLPRTYSNATSRKTDVGEFRNRRRSAYTYRFDYSASDSQLQPITLRQHIMCTASSALQFKYAFIHKNVDFTRSANKNFGQSFCW